MNSGGRYDPTADSWAATSVIDAPSARGFHTAIWSGTQMVVWGGSFWGLTRTDLNSGGRYDPIADAWHPTSVVNAPEPRSNHTAVWTGREMVVWGGSEGYPAISLGTGGRSLFFSTPWTVVGIKAAWRLLFEAGVLDEVDA